ncbi:MAG TPA: hypothetical protein VK640_16335 [Actinomycetes bacterium]|nr:hypothetical protein [Actinomycetes bacterium]
MPTASTLVAAALSGLLSTGSGGGAELVLRLHDPALVESSGLAVSGRHDGVLWTNPDGGEVAQVMAVDGSGDTVATVMLDGIDPYDPEALAPGPDGRSLWLGDLGDNLEERPDVSVFRFTEPRRLGDRTVPARWFRFTYPDGPHDAEALLVNPSTGRLLVATKALGGAGLYRAPARLVAEDEGTNRLERVADVPSLVTDGAFLPDGRFVLRSYTTAYVYDRPGHQVASAPLPRQPQGETVADDSLDSPGSLLVGSEGEDSAVYRVPVPGDAADPSTSAARSSGDSASEERRSGDSASEERGSGRQAEDEAWWRASRVARAVVAVVALVGIVAVLRRRRR